MISDEDVKQLYQDCLRKFSRYWDPDEPLRTQFYRGIGSHFWENQHPGSCERHMSVFNRYNIIPEYCFNCYKVLIKPRTVVELFKLMMVFEALQLVNDNTRKCIVECREQVTGAYKGFVYCSGLEEAKTVKNIVQNEASRDISTDLPVTLKRGCSEYALAYPGYSPEESSLPVMEYKDEWRKLEQHADNIMVYGNNAPVVKSYNQKTYTRQDARIMFAWLSYAAMIGDRSYLKISNCELPASSNVKRPYPFKVLEE